MSIFLNFWVRSKNTPPTFPKQNLDASGPVVYRQLCYVKWKWGLHCVSADHHVEVVEFRVASRVAPHLAGRFPGSTKPDGGIFEVVVGGILPRVPADKHNTHTLGLSAALHQSPCHPPALPSTCLHLTDIWCPVSEKQGGRKMKQLMWDGQSGSPHCPRQWDERHTWRHEKLSSRWYEMSVVWVELYLFSVIEDATPTHCVQWQLRGETDGYKSPINTFSWRQEHGAGSHMTPLSHASSKQKLERATAAAQTVGRSLVTPLLVELHQRKSSAYFTGD